MTPRELYYIESAKSMGKRELLLIVAFVVAGAIVYQATAPPAEPNARGVSLSRLWNHIKREIRGNPASAEMTRSLSHPVAKTVKELRITGGFMDVTITGEARDDIALDIRIVSNGPDEAEARRWAEAVTVNVDASPATVALQAKYPQEGRQRGFFTLKVPARLAVRLDQTSSRASVTNVASLEIVTARNETSIKEIPGRVALTHTGGRLIIETVASLKLSGRRSEATLKDIRGDLALDLQNSELTAGAVTGPISVEARGSEVTFNRLDQARGPVRINALGGSVALHGVSTETRIDGRNTEIEVEMSKPVPVTVYNEGEDPVEVTPAPGGYTLNALATNARVTVPDGTVTVSEMENEQRASGEVSGGGPAITIRANRGDIRVRAAESPKAEPDLNPNPDPKPKTLNPTLDRKPKNPQP